MRWGGGAWERGPVVTQESRCRGEQRKGISYTKWVRRNPLHLKVRRIMTRFRVDGKNSAEEKLMLKK